MSRIPFSLILLFLYIGVNAQITEERTIFSGNYNTSIKDDLYAYQGIKTRVTIPPIGTQKFMIINSIGFDYHTFDYEKSIPFTTSDLERIYAINYAMLLKYNFSKKFSINALAMPFMLSNLRGAISTDDLQINGILFAEKMFGSRERHFLKLSFGVGYLTLAGETRVNPVVSLSGKLNEKFSFVLGLPNTYIEYKFTPQHTLRLVGDINDFTTHLSTPIALDDENTQMADRAVFTVISTGVEYQYWMTKNVGITLRGLHSISDNFELQNTNDDKIFDFQSTTKLYINAGIKISLHKKRPQNGK
ncbi:DUF6268 family outer membrane beta-barrel protein [Aquimarina longa]|uniref:DUF6268 family outer membrane beta-barrel protein n=1 Tax=Aquimarina longa TaxID=1080221 RepID=UPI000785E47C|nr:DUF6268 family outer membrane beta-barrel protein [Aquimarina longa]